MKLGIFGVSAALLLGPGARAEGTAVRVGDHPGYGRVVFDLPVQAGFDTVREGDRVLLVFRGVGPITAPARAPRNVVSITGGADSATLVLSPGAVLRTTRMDGRLVLDVLDRASPPRAAEAARTPVRPAAAPVQEAAERARPGAEPKTPAPSSEATARPAGELKAPAPVPVHVPSVLPAPVAPPVPVRAPEPPRPDPVPAGDAASLPLVRPLALRDAAPPAPKPPVEPAGRAEARAVPATPVHVTPLFPAPPSPGIAARIAPMPTVAPAAAVPAAPAPGPTVPLPAPILVPAEVGTGAAAFRSGGIGVVVLDRRPSGPSTPELAVAGNAATLQLPLPADTSLRLTRVASGWSVEPVPQGTPGTMQAVQSTGGLAFTMTRPGRVVTVLDPVSGGTLLVGTSLDGGAAFAQPDARRTPGFALLPSWLGVVVEASSDAADLRAIASGFVLAGGALPPAAAIPPLTRRFDLPGGDAPALGNRLKAQLSGAATALPRGRPRERLAAASTMIALGMGAEAQALAQLAASDDPQVASDATSQGLIAVAALLAGRIPEADALDDPRLDGTDEIELWRGVRDRRLGKETPAAKRLGDKAPLVLAYAPTLGRLILPDVAEAAVESGAPFPEEKLPPFAKAMLLDRRGKPDEALAALDAVGSGPDRLDQMRATVRAAELRLGTGKIKPLEAAAVMERQSFAWRGDGREAELRMRAAELRGQAGEWRGALTALREVEATFPEQKDAVRARMAGVMQVMLAAEGGQMSPLDVVLLAMEHADAVMNGEAGTALSRLLATKLSALDLPARAIPVLQGLMRGVPQGEGRAALGGRLAQMLLDGDEPGAALAALDGSAAESLPDTVWESRALVRARAVAAQGDVAAAAAGLSTLGTAAADDLRATLLAKAGDWRAASSALADLARKVVPATGPLNEPAQEVLMRLATAAAQAGDPALLRQVAASADRLTAPRDGFFRVLTAAPVTGVSDLPRAARELKLARALPQQTRALAGR